jgi:formylglycine-generating enzyme required for sulfatase activity
VGSAGAAANSYFGTADQAGNVFEWNDAIISSTSRGLRGGSWNSDSIFLAASIRALNTPSNEFKDVGFRVASVPVPEPSAFLVSMLLVSAFLTRRRRTTL